MFEASQPVSIHDPTHFWQIKSGVLLARDPSWPGFWEVGTDFGKRWFHESEMTPAAPPKPAKRKPKAPPRTILIPNWEESPSCSP